MRRRIISTAAGPRRGAAALELAVLLPLMLFLFLIGVDFARVYYVTVTTVNCARNGALYGCLDSTHSTDTAGIKAAALADATNLSPAPDVQSTTGTDAAGNPYVIVTVSTDFHTLINYPGIPSTVPLVRTVQMRVQPLQPLGG